MLRHRPRALVALVTQVALASLLARSAFAQAPASAPASAAPATTPAPAAPAAPATKAPAEADLAAAKELFRRGNKLLEDGQIELALDLFVQSRARVPSVGNTLNAAIALDRLGRSDESLSTYEELLRDFGDRLKDEERKNVSFAMSALRRKVGSVDVAANVEGMVVIDGRKRGVLPLTAPIRLLPGSHTVRVLHDGHAPAEAIVLVKIGEELRVDLRLEALTSTGRLSVADEAGTPDLDVLVDGAPVGVAPWAGTLGAGRHVVALRGKELGTGPTHAVVVAGQTVSVTLRAVPLGPRVRLDPTPATAVVTLDDVVLGPGPWDGRLPLGRHVIAAAEEGYRTRTMGADGGTPGVVRVTLEVDEGHPRWRKLETAKLRVEAFGGVGFTGSLGGAASAVCPDRCTRGASLGVLVGARGAYVLPIGLRFELGAGYLRVASSLSRKESATRPPPAGVGAATYELDDAIVVSGPIATLGLGYGYPVTRALRLTGRTSLGAFFGSARDTVSGRVTRGAESQDVFVEGSGRATRAVDFFVMPELGAEYAIGRVHVAAGLGAGIFLLDGPASGLGDTQVSAAATACTGNPAQLACVANDGGRRGEKAYGSFVLWVPQIGVGTTF